MAAKFKHNNKHTNFLRNDRYQAKLNASKTVTQNLSKRGVKSWVIVALSIFVPGELCYWESWSFKP